MSDPITRLNAALDGRYQIERELGEGGMATVYLAKDVKHNRNVALKVLKPELAAVVGAERFLAEIETTANLQHPHILPLFDSGEAGSFLFYVMPYIEGETLRDRIDREKQLPVDEALGIATAVANALHAAHSNGVVHRDIKPGNILLSQGQPLVADFGIALAVSAGGGGRLTETGLSLGTPYYMSPEQATGDQAVGPASDTFALACVLYEMLVGEPPYPGNTAQAVLGKIIQGEPVSATTVRRSVPTNVDAAIRKALERLPADRFTGAQGFAKALADPSFRHGEHAVAGVSGSGSPWNRLSIGMTIVSVVLALSTAWAFLRPGPPEAPRHIERFEAPFQEGQEPTTLGPTGFDLSPDGTMVVYRIPGGRLMVRRWDDPTATLIRETGASRSPAVSHDGLEVAWGSVDGDILVAAFAGGPVRTLTAGVAPEWGRDGFVYATTDSGAVRVPSTGGAVEYVSRLSEGEEAHFVYDLLPGDRGALLMVDSDQSREIRTLDLETGEMSRIVDGQYPRYALSGHLVYTALDGTVMAAIFDPDRMEMSGTPIAVMDGVASWSIAEDGKFFYSRGGSSSSASGPVHQLAWVTRAGQASPVDPDWAYNRGPDAEVGLGLSADGSMVVLREFSQGGYDIWLKRLDAGSHSRLTFHEADEKMPVWEPGGRNVTFLSNRNGNFDVWSKAADGTGEPELLLDLEEDLLSARWSPDGEWLVLWTADEDILAYRPGEDTEPIPLLAGEYDAQDATISPDGRWIAYASDETGENHVYVRPFPDVNAGRWQVSSSPARYPRWAHGGRELYFQDNGAAPSMWMVEYEATEVFRFETPIKMFESPGWVGSGQFGEAFEVAPEDDRFLIPTLAQGNGDGSQRAPFILINNFFEELKRLVPN